MRITTLAAAALLAACAPYRRAGALPTAAGASGRSACGAQHGGRASPLVVDLQPEQRSDLEVALRRGVVVVRYDCKSLEVLERCRAVGGYAYAGTAPKEQVIRMTNADAVRATLPLTGPALAGSIGGELERGASLDLALVMVGKLTATRPVMSTDDLRGQCAGATHVVYSATLGAFALKTGAQSKVATVAGVFGVGVSAKSRSARSISTRDGDLSRCASAGTSDSGPIEGCAAALRIELLPLRQPPPAIAVLTADQAERLRGKVCPDPEECRRRCEKNDATACAHYGTVLAIGDRVPRDLGRSTRAFQRACELDNIGACTLLGIALLTRGNARADADRGRKMLRRPCERGQVEACMALGLSSSRSGNTARARAYFRRACSLGNSDGCRRAKGD